MRVGRQIEEMIQLHRPEIKSRDEALRFMQWVGIADPEARMRCYPHELSGGMQQRVMIAMALSSRPQLLVADEPTTALDVTIQAQILDLLRDTQKRLHMAILLITHNLAIISNFAGRVAVMYAGQVVEMAAANALLSNPLHPYSRALMDSAPALGKGSDRLQSIPGQVPNLDAMPAGCRFNPRCAHFRNECARQEPEWIEPVPGHWVRCPYSQISTL
jgi:oligopeptide/dipeptide ABC transporter ATP-binding protein